jgi:serine/threonine-protein kinase
VGEPCATQVCTDRGYHHVPLAYAPRSESDIPDPMIGLRIDEYLVVGWLGAGTFGKVYLALQQPVGLKAAVKLLDLQQFPQAVRPALLEKFEAEARALALVQHPNVVRLFRYSEILGQPYLVTDFVEGGVTLEDDIEARVKATQGYSLQEIAGMLRQVLDGLFAVHEQGIIHRDVKPANLMLQDSPGYPRMVRILDFGLAKFLERGDVTMTTSGTPDYMAPEQFTLEPLGPYTDLYAVGVIAYELLTGVKPFSGDSIQKVLFNKVNREYDPLELIADMKLPGEVLDFLSRSLAIDPDHRYRSAAAMRLGVDRAFEVFDLRPSLVPEEVLLGGLLGGYAASHEHTALVIPLHEANETRPAQSSEGAFQDWLAQEQERLSIDDED